MKKIICMTMLLGASLFADNLFQKLDKNIEKGEAKVDKSIKDTKDYIDNKKDKIQNFKQSKEDKVDKTIKDTKDYINNKTDKAINQTKDFLSK